MHDTGRGFLPILLVGEKAEAGLSISMRKSEIMPVQNDQSQLS